MKWFVLGVLNLFLISSAFSDVKRISFSDVCICKDGRSLSQSSCQSSCADYGDTYGGEILFAKLNFIPSVRIFNAKQWCNKVAANPRCVMEAKDLTGNVHQLDVNFLKSNTAFVNVDPLAYDSIYSLTLVELSTGKSTNTIQISKRQR